VDEEAILLQADKWNRSASGKNANERVNVADDSMDTHDGPVLEVRMGRSHCRRLILYAHVGHAGCTLAATASVCSPSGYLTGLRSVFTQGIVTILPWMLQPMQPSPSPSAQGSLRTASELAIRSGGGTGAWSFPAAQSYWRYAGCKGAAPVAFWRAAAVSRPCGASPFASKHSPGCEAGRRCQTEPANSCTAGADLLGDHHGYLLRMRLEGGLDGIELGPQLGRGSYGKVYKGAPAVCETATSRHWHPATSIPFRACEAAPLCSSKQAVVLVLWYPQGGGAAPSSL
jgi:hypothetical protein